MPKYKLSISKLLYPKSVAVIGASAKGGIGNAIVKNILETGFKGNVYAINRSGVDVLGVKAYKTVGELPEIPSLAIITTPSGFVAQAIEDCGEAGVGNVVCISAGFKEVGEAGAREEAKLKRLIDYYNMRMLGPNGMGMINTDPEVSLNATMLQHQPQRGNVALVTQSGAIGAVLLDYAEEMGIGFSKVTSLGNVMDLDVTDILLELSRDVNTDTIIVYSETIGKGYRFKEVLEKVSKLKNVIVVKSGKTEAGAIAASSHTGSIAGSDEVINAIIEGAGAIRVESLEMAFTLGAVLSKSKPINGNKIGVITNAGGPGILVTDRLVENGFEVPILHEDERKRIGESFLPEASTGNPIDLVAAADPEHYAIALDAMGSSELYDALIVMCIPPATIDTGEVAKKIAPVAKRFDLPVISCFMGPSLGAEARKVLLENELPFVNFPEKTADVLKCLHIIGERKEKFIHRESYDAEKINYKRRTQGKKLIKSDYSTGYLSSTDGFNLLELYNIPCAKWMFANSQNDVENIKLNFPVVAKIEHKEIVHKSDMGGVILNIRNKHELKNVVSKLLVKFEGAEGVFIQEMADTSHEMIIGAKYEPYTGHLCLIGAGGILVELYKDVSLGIAPLDKTDAEEMIKKLNTYPLLNGYRGKPKADIDKLTMVVESFNVLLNELPEIKEIDLNPVVWDKENKQFIAIDCRVRV